MAALVFPILLGIGMLGGRAGAGSPADAPPPATVHVVRAGDSLWAIAERLAGPGEDPRPVVDAIVDLNGLEGAVISPGQSLRLPR